MVHDQDAHVMVGSCETHSSMARMRPSDSFLHGQDATIATILPVPITAVAVRIYPRVWSNASAAPSLRFELYTHCVWGEDFTRSANGLSQVSACVPCVCVCVCVCVCASVYCF